MNARLIGLVAGVLLAMYGMGLIAPVPAHANDTGKVLLGVAAGVIIAGLIDNSRDCHHSRVYAYPRTYAVPAWRYAPRVYAVPGPRAVVVVPEGRHHWRGHDYRYDCGRR